MAKIKDNLLSGILGEVIISHRYGKPYIRRKPKKVHNPRTTIQQNQRSKFKAATQFVSQNLETLIRPYWNPEGRRLGMSGQNLFCKLNTHAFDFEGNLNVEKLQPVPGNLGGVEALRLHFAQPMRLALSWENNARDRKTSGQNQLIVFGMREDFIVRELCNSALRKHQSCMVNYNEEVYPYFFCFFWNPLLKMASKGEWAFCNDIVKI